MRARDVTYAPDAMSIPRLCECRWVMRLRPERGYFRPDGWDLAATVRECPFHGMPLIAPQRPTPRPPVERFKARKRPGLRKALRNVTVPADGEPLDDREMSALVETMRELAVNGNA
jgi:hypothetical protein